MGVYIKKMKMPRSCVECRLLRVESNDEWVGKYCPLVEVTEPHGRLIDELK